MTSRELILLFAATFVLAQDKYPGDACILKDGTRGICESIETCEWFKSNYESKIITYADTVRCGFDKSVEIICCGRGIKQKVGEERPAEAACAKFPEYKESDFSDHIIGGEAADEGEFPFMAALSYESQDKDEIWRCGATLISEKFLVTAGHCLPKSNKPLFARFGTNTLEGDPGTNRYDFAIKNTMSHPNYTSSRNYHDIALIELEAPVKFTSEISPACLYTDRKDLPSTRILSAEGWGVVETKKWKQSIYLQKVNLTTVALPECKLQLEDLLKKSNQQRKVPLGILESQYCATGKKIGDISGDTCKGDSGGPLQILSGKKYQLVGVTSFGVGCGTDKPGVYTRVAYYIDWIESVVWAK